MATSTSNTAQPFLKWAGGKRQLLPEIQKYIPSNFQTYYEPFVGAGAVLFGLQPKNAIINDINSELINTYQVIKNNVDELIEELKKHKNESDYFYEIRNWDRTDEYAQRTAIQKASRIIYLNKTCFNGLYRVNRKGQFNVPFGKYKDPKYVNEQVLRSVSDYLNNHNVTIMNKSYAEAVSTAKEGDFVYFDPPYDPVSTTSDFTSYSLDGFTKEDQIQLRDVFSELDKKGCYVLLSNSATDFILDIYKDYKMVTVQATRSINSVASKRGKIDEVLIMNYETK
nr:DNA adenine methylase [Halalkalibacterium ligniniphilum]